MFRPEPVISVPGMCVLCFALISFQSALAQRYTCEDGKVIFFSDAPVEDIEAVNNKVSSIFTADRGVIVFSVPIKEFQFEKKLMQEHFNDKYMESARFPRSTFAGTLSGYSLDKSCVQDVRAVGNLTIHGILRSVDVKGTLEVKGSTLIMKAKFKVLMAHYDIKIPAILWENISEEVEVTLDLTYKK